MRAPGGGDPINVPRRNGAPGVVDAPNNNTSLVFTSLVLFLLCGGFILFSLSSYQVREGHVGIRYRLGALQNETVDPGLHFKVPFLDQTDEVLIQVQTDQVKNIPCGTAGGVMIQFERVEVVNRLKKHLVYDTIKNYTTNYDKLWIFDRVHHEINVFCSLHTLQEVYIDKFGVVDDTLVSALQRDTFQYAPGIEILAVRVTKPVIPSHILANYETMEAEKTRFLIAVQTQKVSEKQAETERRRAVISAEQAADVLRINLASSIMQREAEARLSYIEDEILQNRTRSRADAEAYERRALADSNSYLLTPEYLALTAVQQLSGSTRVYFGPSLPSAFLDVGQLVQAFGSAATVDMEGRNAKGEKNSAPPTTATSRKNLHEGDYMKINPPAAAIAQVPSSPTHHNNNQNNKHNAAGRTPSLADTRAASTGGSGSNSNSGGGSSSNSLPPSAPTPTASSYTHDTDGDDYDMFDSSDEF